MSDYGFRVYTGKRTPLNGDMGQPSFRKPDDTVVTLEIPSDLTDQYEVGVMHTLTREVPSANFQLTMRTNEASALDFSCLGSDVDDWGDMRPNIEANRTATVTFVDTDGSEKVIFTGEITQSVLHENGMASVHAENVAWRIQGQVFLQPTVYSGCYG